MQLSCNSLTKFHHFVINSHKSSINLKLIFKSSESAGPDDMDGVDLANNDLLKAKISRMRMQIDQFMGHEDEEAEANLGAITSGPPAEQTNPHGAQLYYYTQGSGKGA